MQSLLDRYEQKHGYRPTLAELYSLYTQGQLVLSDTEEDALLQAMEQAEA